MFGPNLMGMLLGGVAIAAIAGGAGWMARGEIQNSTLGKNFEKAIGNERFTSLSREVNLWSAVGNANRAQRELVDKFELINTLSAEARGKLLAAMKREREEAAAAEAEARSKIKELSDAASDMAEAWKRGVIPPDITCGVFNGTGCPAPAYPGSGPDPDDGVEVRDGRAPAAEGSPS